MRKPVEKLTRAELLRAIEAANLASSKLLDELIAAGRGNETFAVTRTRKDELSLRYLAACDWESELSFEKNRREQFHGKLTPIRREAAL